MASGPRLLQHRLARNGFHQQALEKYEKVLLHLFMDLLQGQVLGVLLNEVGNMSDLVTVEGKKLLEEVLVAAFSGARARHATVLLERGRDNGGIQG